MYPKDDDNNIILESGKTFPESMIWKLQKQYYCDNGIYAWQAVPSEPTSSPFIGNSYAQICVAFIKDVIAQNKNAMKHPFYIMELGSGSGRFSFYFIKRIHELLALSDLADIKIRFIMTDIAKKNIEFYKSHPRFEPYIKSGVLDFASFELESTDPINLQIADCELTKEMLVNPLITVGNYIFDTCSHEALSVSNKKIRQVLIDLLCRPDNLENGRVKSIEKLYISMHPSEKIGYQSNDETVNKIIDLYVNKLQSGSILLLPIGSFNIISRLKDLSSNKMLLLTTDKGYAKIEAMPTRPPQLAVHGDGCFSMMVNFHALKLFFELNGGDSHIEQQVFYLLTTAAYTFGYQFSQLPNTNSAISSYIDLTSPGKYHSNMKHIWDDFKNYDALIVIMTHDSFLIYLIA